MSTLTRKKFERQKVMNIEIFTLSKYAEETNGTLSIQGIFDVINAPQLPVVLPACYLALRFRSTKDDLQNHHFKIRFLDPDGKDIIPIIDADYRNQTPTQYDTFTANLALQMGNCQFKVYGKYSIDLSIDGHSQRTFPLYINKPNIPNTGQAGTAIN